jgi:DNA-binding LacI/PurR family transcriptional regulator
LLDRLGQPAGRPPGDAHLARLGRKRIVFLGETDPEALQRRAGYLDALRRAGSRPIPP